MRRKSRWHDALEDAPVEDQEREIDDDLKRSSGRMRRDSDGHSIFASLLRSNDKDDDDANDHDIEADALKTRSDRLAFIRNILNGRRK